MVSCSLKAVLALAALLVLAPAAHAVPVSYVANYTTTKGNPITDILIMETDGVAPVHATVYGSDLPGTGISVIAHEAPFAPTQSLIIALTEGCDADGNDQTQLVMFLNDDFAAANTGVKFSVTFPGARHNATITNLQAAVAGDATQLTWFADTFFYGPAAGAAFDPRGSFTVAGFTELENIGNNATAGNWMIMGFQSLEDDDMNAQSNRVTAVIDETAKVDKGPFDIELTLDDDGVFAIDKTVVNDTGGDWVRFVMELGTGTGANFVPSPAGDDFSFFSGNDTREETGAFPGVVVEQDRITYSGFLAAGGTARFITFVRTEVNEDHTLTVRQRALCKAAAPALGPWAFAVLVVLLCGIATLRIRREASATGSR